MRKVVSEEMVAAAVEHCRREGQNPSRGRVMGLLAQTEFGGCAGDPARVGAMIREHLTRKEGEETAVVPTADGPCHPLPPQIEEVLAQTAQRMSDSMCSLADAVASELGSIKSELRTNYDQAAEQLRRDADRAVSAAQADEQDAMNALEDALVQKALLEERAEVLQSEHLKALAVAAERGEQLLRVEAELERTRTEAAAANARLVAERDEARRDAQLAEKSLRNQESLVAAQENKIAAIQTDLDGFRLQAGVSQSVADERASRITQLESLLAEALRDIRNPAKAAENSPDEAFSGQDHGTASAEAAGQPEGAQMRSNHGDGKIAKPAKPTVKNHPARLGDGQEPSGVSA